MRLNVFRLNDRREDWRAVENAMYQIWIGNQAGAILPRCCDFEFKAMVEKMKKNYTLNDCKQVLNLA